MGEDCDSAEGGVQILIIKQQDMREFADGCL
jgi:hypothetical protein